MAQITSAEARCEWLNWTRYSDSFAIPLRTGIAIRNAMSPASLPPHQRPIRYTPARAAAIEKT